ncbi:MAG: GNAT family N-acetyltransferase [Paracoccaceae bacterium]
MIFVRTATPQDAPTLAALLNAIIAAGGTTAYQTPLTADEFNLFYLAGPGSIAAFVVQSGPMTVGFQVLEAHPSLPRGWADIGTYVAEAARGAGAAAALFRATRAIAARRGIATINATIRADNPGGLRYYDKMGFTDYAADPDWALDDGTRVGRVSKRFDL